jgi:hypothetical protein
MLKSSISLLLKLCFQMVFWVLVFSIEWQGKILFSHARELVLHNKFAKSADEYFSNLWYKVEEKSSKVY